MVRFHSDPGSASKVQKAALAVHCVVVTEWHCLRECIGLSLVFLEIKVRSEAIQRQEGTFHRARLYSGGGAFQHTHTRFTHRSWERARLSYNITVCKLQTFWHKCIDVLIILQAWKQNGGMMPNMALPSSRTTLQSTITPDRILRNRFYSFEKCSRS